MLASVGGVGVGWVNMGMSRAGMGVAAERHQGLGDGCCCGGRGHKVQMAVYIVRRSGTRRSNGPL